jgi:signal transduction histidine kinase
LDNSVKYTDRGGLISCKVSLTNQWIKFHFFDDGMGIEKSNLKRIFRRFFRAEKTSLKKVQGSGLGLFVCQTIVKAHQGKIFASSDGPGKGSHFHVELPRQTIDY